MDFPYSYDQWAAMGQKVQLDDGEVFYVNKGKGSPVVMLHLYGGNSWWFSRVLDVFSERFNVYVMDLPGCAKSETPPLPYGPPEYAETLLEFMNKLGIDRAHVVGSHGSSFTSAHFSATFPTRVAKLVLEGVPPWNRQEGRQVWKEIVQPDWLDENELPKPLEQWSGLDAPFSILGEEEREVALQRANEDLREHGKWIASMLKGALKYDVYRCLPLIQASTLLVYGEKDLGRSSELRVKNGIVGSRLATVDGTGEYPAFENPNQYSEIILDFLTD